MEIERPAEGILLHRDYGDAQMYTVTCECCDTDHTHQVWIESEDTGITVTTYTKQKSKWWSMNRWQKIWTLLTRGYIEYEASIIMTQQQALNYARTLERAITDVDTFKKQRKTINA